MESVSFDFGFNSLIICDSSKIQLQFSSPSRHIYSNVGSMILTYSGFAEARERPAGGSHASGGAESAGGESGNADTSGAPGALGERGDGGADNTLGSPTASAPSSTSLAASKLSEPARRPPPQEEGPAPRRIPFTVSLSDSFNPPESLALGQPWRVTYRVSSPDPPPQLWNLGCVGVSPPGGSLATLLITSSEPFDIGEILIENHLCAEIAVRLDGDLLFEGALRNEPGTQNVSLCHGRFLGQPVGVSAWDGQVTGLDNGSVAPL